MDDATIAAIALAVLALLTALVKHVVHIESGCLGRPLFIINLRRAGSTTPPLELPVRACLPPGQTPEPAAPDIVVTDLDEENPAPHTPPQ